MPEHPIRARAIIEMLGAPKEHVEGTLKRYVEQLKRDGLAVLREEHAPAEETQPKLFSAFVELEVRLPDVPSLLAFCFDSMPSSVEIIEPENLTFTTKVLTDFLNDLQARIHETDALVKTVKARHKVLDINALNVFQNFILFQLKQGPRSVDELASPMGIVSDDLAPFLKRMEEQGRITFDGAKYALAS
jgi:hypothetical protein